jgi:hypothetical protein
MHPQRLPLPLELICPCGITFEPLPWFDSEDEELHCDECADSLR